MAYFAYVLSTASIMAFLFQSAIDYGSSIGAVLAVVATVVTVLGQIKQKRLETEVNANAKVIEAWDKLLTERGDEMRDLRRRLRQSENLHRLCERGQLKLVAQLIKAGVEIDLDSILDGLTKAEVELLHFDDKGERSSVTRQEEK